MAQIVLLHYASPPIVGGVEHVLARQAELLADAGHKVTVLTGRGAAWDSRIDVHVVPEMDSRHPQVLAQKQELDRGIVPASFQPLADRLFQTLVSTLKEMDWIIAHNVASMHKNLALTVALRRFSELGTGSGVILWHHDFAWNSGRYNGELHPGYPWDLLRLPWPGVRQVTISEARRDEMSRLFAMPADRIKVIPNGIDPDEFHRLLPETRKLMIRNKLDSANPLLLTPVRLTRRKNLEFGLQIIAELVREMPDIRWVITGPVGAHNPDNLAYFQQLIALRKSLNLEKKVIFMAESFPDGLSDGQIADFYRIADALLITSQEEGFGLPVIEAGLARLVLFTTDLPPLHALGGDWITYFRLNDSPAEVAKRIAKRLKSDPAYCLREHIRAHFTWDAIYRKQISPLLDLHERTEVEK